MKVLCSLRTGQSAEQQIYAQHLLHRHLPHQQTIALVTSILLGFCKVMLTHKDVFKVQSFILRLLIPCLSKSVKHYKGTYKLTMVFLQRLAPFEKRCYDHSASRLELNIVSYMDLGNQRKHQNNINFLFGSKLRKSYGNYSKQSLERDSQK